MGRPVCLGPRLAHRGLSPPGRDPQGGRARARILPTVGSFRHKPGPSDADEAPERGEDDDREGKGVRRHGGVLVTQTRVRSEMQMLRGARVPAG